MRAAFSVSGGGGIDSTAILAPADHPRDDDCAGELADDEEDPVRQIELAARFRHARHLLGQVRAVEEHGGVDRRSNGAGKQDACRQAVFGEGE